ncbi:endoplasmic reticulum oxidoreductin family protein NDAI_0K00160 [Naumovozyma dairenensis CBS 421]|uniref:Endoplasmic oxidoreductin-1 n=1 Tax=Naumovozyma dairenensis (strain ATCC 10597 / BCRC 20456 / CBS 421 / NBRC 0211 / NRRL Y-12639) TaxID=1071378 RepID=G0WHE4_NAUDC|nr:hypothetical protein NDAI_0K00160 [Naumovozyma dairenensis CBS 421]CCD27205.1 hypothetical protein NDAI_0K00160 [Naumovozyma dairenensis CBS 421]
MLGLLRLLIYSTTIFNIITVRSDFCKINKGETLSPVCDITFNELNELNNYIKDDLNDLTKTEFFKYFKFDFNNKCRFWKEENNPLCFNKECSVDVIEDWESLPEIWQPEVLGKISTRNVEDSDIHDDECWFLEELCDHERRLPEIPDCNYCDLNDFEDAKCLLVDLTANPERFTGYGGNQSAEIWSAIYNDNCFSIGGETGESLAKETFYRIISGFQASIATHLSMDFLNIKTGKWEPNLEIFMKKVGSFPERVANIYFNYAIVGKSLLKIQPYLKEIGFCNEYHEDVKSQIVNICSQLDSSIFNEEILFDRNEVSLHLKEEFKRRFRNVTKIMDCVQCERCRLWGKVQTTGYATTLKILFELDQNDEETRRMIVEKLTKYELIGLINTFALLSQSIDAINQFEGQYQKRIISDEKLKKLANFFDIKRFYNLLKKTKPEVPLKGILPVDDFEDLVATDDEELQSFKKSITPNWVNSWRNTDFQYLKEFFEYIKRHYFSISHYIHNRLNELINNR